MTFHRLLGKALAMAGVAGLVALAASLSATTALAWSYTVGTTTFTSGTEATQAAPGQYIHDSATITVDSQYVQSGTLDFYLYQGTAPETCSTNDLAGTGAVESYQVTVVRTASSVLTETVVSPSFQIPANATASETYWWVAVYNDSEETLQQHSACNSEIVTVSPPPLPQVAVTTTCGGSVSFTGGIEGYGFSVYGPGSPWNWFAGVTTSPIGGGTVGPLAPGTYEYAYAATGSGVVEGTITIAACVVPTPTTTKTVASTGGPPGTPVSDTATVVAKGTIESAAVNAVAVPTGTVTFSLYGPSDSATCTSSDLVFGPDSQLLSNGSATSSSDADLTTPGTYYWTAIYVPASAISAFAVSSSGCGVDGESVTITPTPTITPTITPLLSTTTTTTTAASVGGPLTTSVTDTATVAPVTGSTVPAGTVTFDLYDTANCSDTPVFGTVAETLSGGTATSSPGFAPLAAGTYYWTASYLPAAGSGFAASFSPCGAFDESVTIALPPAGAVSAAHTTPGAVSAAHTTPTPTGAVLAVSTPVTGADLFLPGLLAVFAFLFGGLLLLAGVRLQRRPTL